ncbi:MAG TPA: HAMP domain-containing sensor histidine kinase [Bacteroidales bacterium]|nr:HAMP domain-containing sensor histidine kinase [Bacteroidales bacterium]
MKKISDQYLIEELERRFSDNNNTILALKHLTEELKTVNKKLEESEAMKSHFISHITNEIINPFTSILGLSKSILSVEKENWKKVISMVALIHSEAFNLDFQLRNIFITAKIEAGEIYPEISNVQVESLLKSMADAFRLEANKKNLVINLHVETHNQTDGMFRIKTDPEKIKLILGNLLSNAIKFSIEGGQIDISAWKKDNLCYFKVQDFGTGISKENQKIIFDRFKQLDSGINSMNRGHGLGLSVNKALIDMFEGTIEITSKPGEGASFLVSIPEPDAGAIGFSNEGNDFLFEDNEVF